MAKLVHLTITIIQWMTGCCNGCGGFEPGNWPTWFFRNVQLEEVFLGECVHCTPLPYFQLGPFTLPSHMLAHFPKYLEINGHSLSMVLLCVKNIYTTYCRYLFCKTVADLKRFDADPDPAFFKLMRTRIPLFFNWGGTGSRFFKLMQTRILLLYWCRTGFVKKKCFGSESC